jgi:tetratricopeptide (TPR) repeat protein
MTTHGLFSFKSIDELREEWEHIPSSRFKVMLWHYATMRFKQYIQVAPQLPNKQEVLNDAVEKAIYVIGDLPIGSLDDKATFTEGSPISTIIRAMWVSVTTETAPLVFDDISKELKRRAEETEGTGKIELLDMAIDNKINMLRYFETETEVWAHATHNLATYFETRFLWTGNEGDWERAFELSTQAIRAESPNCRNFAIMLDGLATKNGEKFERTRNSLFLEEAKRLSGQAVDITVQNDPNDYKNLAIFYHHRSIISHLEFTHLEIPSSLNESVAAATRAFQYAQKNPPLPPKLLDNLGQRHFLRYMTFGSAEDKTDLNEALKYSSLALGLTPDDHPDRADILNTLALIHQGKYSSLHGLSDLDTAIDFAQLSISGTGSDRVELARRHLNLANMHRERFLLTGSAEWAINALRNYELSAQTPTAPIYIRIMSTSRAGLLYAEQKDWHNARIRLEASLDLLRKFNFRFLNQKDQQEILKNMGGMSSIAASVILEDGGQPWEALQALEDGRCIISNTILESRVDLSGLIDINEDLYKRYVKLLDSWSMPPSAMEDGIGTMSPSAYFLIREGVTGAIEEAEEEIRQQPGFQHFRMPKSAENFAKHAQEGPIVCFNATEFRSDAFIITTSGVEVLNLPTLKYDDLARHAKSLTDAGWITYGPDEELGSRNKELCRILTWLWIHAVGPSLDQLSSSLQNNTAQDLPRVCWVTNGLLGMTPLHAAALDASKPSKNAMSLVSSSYASSLESLAYSREASASTITIPRYKALMIIMPRTTGFPGELVVDPICQELNKIVSSFGNWDFEALNTPSKGSVLEKLRTAHMVIFACHGMVDSVNPSKSGILLRDDANGIPERLTFQDLTSISLKHVRLACLFACSTAESSNVLLRDEVLHVTLGFQIAGFPHVVGTLWPIDDYAANAALKKLFETYFRQRDGESVTAAFQAAVNEVRMKRNGRGIRTDVISWAPFVNFGHSF